MPLNPLELARYLGQGKAVLSRLQVAAGAFQVLVVLAERPMPGPSERFVKQLRSAEVVNSCSQLTWINVKYLLAKRPPETAESPHYFLHFFIEGRDARR